MKFTNEQIERYSRNIILPDIGGVGQERLLASRVLLIGAGGLGSPCALYLAAAGVGALGVIDSDDVDLSNLQRQVLHTTQDVGRPKAHSAKARLEALNPDVSVTAYHERLTASNVLDIAGGYDVLVDGADNFPTKYLANDAAVLLNKPLVHSGIFRYEGQLMTVVPGVGPCYRCLFPEPPPSGLIPSCQEAGILGSVAGVMGSLQATEVVKVLLGIGEPFVGRMLIYNAIAGRFRIVTVPKDEACAVCGRRPTIRELKDVEQPVCRPDASAM